MNGGSQPRTLVFYVPAVSGAADEALTCGARGDRINSLRPIAIGRRVFE